MQYLYWNVIWTKDYSFDYSFLGIPLDPCSPSPCGPNSKCREVNSQAVCTCLPEYRGIPPNCRPECVVNAECPPHLACLNKKCTDPCPNTCGVRALCTTKNHNPICTCPVGFTGDPFFQCSPSENNNLFILNYFNKKIKEFNIKYPFDSSRYSIDWTATILQSIAMWPEFSLSNYIRKSSMFLLTRLHRCSSRM